MCSLVISSFKENSELRRELARGTRNGGLTRRVSSKDEITKPSIPIIFFGNGPLADSCLQTLQKDPAIKILLHARSAKDLAEAARLKRQHPEAHGVLASFGVLIKPDFLQIFEPEGILNLHPSLLPKYRGPSPIESAILAGDTDFSFSIMKLAVKMDAGPIYYQNTLSNLPLNKSAIYQALATAGAEWLLTNINHLPTPVPQDEQTATYTKKLQKSASILQPEKYSAPEILRQIIAFQGFPKPKYTFFGKTCIILAAHVVDVAEVICEPSDSELKNSPLALKCADRNFVVIDKLQPEGKKPMDAISFINGYGKNRP